MLLHLILQVKVKCSSPEPIPKSFRAMLIWLL